MSEADRPRLSCADHRPATMRDVAAMAGVGIKTVSRVVNEEPYVSEDVKSRVRDAIAALGYERNLDAANLRRGRLRTP